MPQTLRIFVGWDSKEPLAFAVLAHSILRRATIPVSITPLTLASVAKIYARPRGPLESTEFSMTRFLVPYLCDYEGWAVFMDCDMLCRCDVADLLAEMLAQRTKAVSVCQHDYVPRAATKFLGQPQTAYPRKNWSSLMFFQNRLCKALSPAYVNKATGLELHRLTWMQESFVGSLPLAYNWLVGEYPENPQAKILHYTLGGPWFAETSDCPSADDWYAEYAHLLNVGAGEPAILSPTQEK